MVALTAGFPGSDHPVDDDLDQEPIEQLSQADSPLWPAEPEVFDYQGKDVRRLLGADRRDGASPGAVQARTAGERFHRSREPGRRPDSLGGLVADARPGVAVGAALRELPGRLGRSSTSRGCCSTPARSRCSARSALWSRARWWRTASRASVSRARGLLFTLLIATIFLPGAVTLIPTYLIWVKAGVVGSNVPFVPWIPLILPAFLANAFDVFLLRQYFMTIPREMDEAAAMDGAGPMRTLVSVILPQAWPAIAAIGIFSFVYSWNDYFGPLIYLSTHQDLQPISVALARFSGVYYTKPALHPGRDADGAGRAGRAVPDLPALVSARHRHHRSREIAALRVALTLDVEHADRPSHAGVTEELLDILAARTCARRCSSRAAGHRRIRLLARRDCHGRASGRLPLALPRAHADAVAARPGRRTCAPRRRPFATSPGSIRGRGFGRRSARWIAARPCSSQLTRAWLSQRRLARRLARLGKPRAGWRRAAHHRRCVEHGDGAIVLMHGWPAPNPEACRASSTSCGARRRVRDRRCARQTSRPARPGTPVRSDERATDLPLILGIDGGNSKVDIALRDGRQAAGGRVRGADDLAPTGRLRRGHGAAQGAGRRAASPRLGDDSPRPDLLVATVAGADYPEDVRSLRTAITRLELARDVVVAQRHVRRSPRGHLGGWGVGLVCGQGINAGAIAPNGTTGALSGSRRHRRRLGRWRRHPHGRRAGRRSWQRRPRPAHVAGALGPRLLRRQDTGSDDACLLLRPDSRSGASAASRRSSSTRPRPVTRSRAASSTGWPTSCRRWPLRSSAGST